MAAITVIGAKLSHVITTVLRLYYGLDALLVMEGSWFTATDRFAVLGHGAYQPLTWVLGQQFYELTSRLCRRKNIALEKSGPCAIRRETGYTLIDGRIAFCKLDLPHAMKYQSKNQKALDYKLRRGQDYRYVHVILSSPYAPLRIAYTCSSPAVSSGWPARAGKAPRSRSPCRHHSTCLQIV